VSAPERPAPRPLAEPAPEQREPAPERSETPHAGPPVGLAVGPDGRAGGPSPTLPRLRRPSGYPPALPRAWNGRTVALLIALALWLLVWVVAYLPVGSPPRRVDGLLVDLLARDHRTALTASEGLGLRTSTVRNGTAVTYSALPDGGVVTATYSGGCPTQGQELSSSTLPLGAEARAVGTGRVLVTFPGGCVRLDYQEDALGRAELALPELLDAVRLVPRWRLNAYVLQLTEGREPHL